VRDAWLELVDTVLRPARPHRERCLRERELHVAARRLIAEGRARAIAGCVARIESARAAIFAANDGVVPARMRDLEREWQRHARVDLDGGVMDLWARVAPPAWMDRKRWRDSEPAAQIDAAVALASDVEGVEAAEAAIVALRVALAAWGTPIGARIRWRMRAHDFERTAELLAAPLGATHGVHTVALERAKRLEEDVLAAAHARFPERPLLERALGHAALVDAVWRAASLSGRPDPVTPLRALWRTGYVLSEVDRSGVVVEIPPL
jgi:hypothetical protein